MENEILNVQSKQLVLNVLEYFDSQKGITQENISVIKCASEALKLKPGTILKVVHQFSHGIQEKVSDILSFGFSLSSKSLITLIREIIQWTHDSFLVITYIYVNI